MFCHRSVVRAPCALPRGLHTVVGGGKREPGACWDALGQVTPEGCIECPRGPDPWSSLAHTKDVGPDSRPLIPVSTFTSR